MDGKAHGKGTVQWFTNGVPTSSYVGEMRVGLSDGHGITKTQNEEYEGNWLKGNLISTNATIRYADENWYKGEIKGASKLDKVRR